MLSYYKPGSLRSTRNPRDAGQLFSHQLMDIRIYVNIYHAYITQKNIIIHTHTRYSHASLQFYLLYSACT